MTEGKEPQNGPTKRLSGSPGTKTSSDPALSLSRLLKSNKEEHHHMICFQHVSDLAVTDL